MSIEAMSAVWNCSALSSSQKLVSLYIADKVNDDHNNLFFGSKANCVLLTGLDRHAVFKAFNDLVKKGFIVKTGKKEGTRLVYRFILNEYLKHQIKKKDKKTNSGESPTVNSVEKHTINSVESPTQYQEEPKKNPSPKKVSKKTVFGLHKEQVTEEKTEQVIRRYNHLVKYLRAKGIDKQPLLEHDGKVLEPNHSTQLAITNFLSNHTIEEWEAYIKGLADHRRELLKKTWINNYTSQEQTWDLKLLLNNYERILNNEIN